MAVWYFLKHLFTSFIYAEMVQHWLNASTAENHVTRGSYYTGTYILNVVQPQPPLTLMNALCCCALLKALTIIVCSTSHLSRA